MHDLTVVFDLDGTLVETAPDLIGSINHALGLEGLVAIEAALIRPHISFGGRAMLEHGLRLREKNLIKDEVDRLHAAFLEHYAANIAVDSHCYPGLETALTEIERRGAKLAVCTNKPERLSRQLLETLGLMERFDALAGRDTFAVCKPDPEHLRGAIRLAGGDPANAVMVGDSDTDIKTARAAGIPVIAVPFGYTDIPVYDLGADAIVEHYDDLVGAIDRIRRR